MVPSSPLRYRSTVARGHGVYRPPAGESPFKEQLGDAGRYVTTSAVVSLLLLKMP